MGKLISYQYLRSETDISQNIPDKELDFPIKRAQEMLSMVLGVDLYAEIDSQYPNSLSTANHSLYNPYIKQFLAWQAYQFWIVKANFKTTPSGIRVHSEENSTPATDLQMASLIRDAKEMAQTYKEKMLYYIKLNIDNYPLYGNNCNSNNNSGTGFHITAIGGKHSKYCGCSSCNGFR